MKKMTVFGFLGTILDNRPFAKRWNIWRPTVALCQHKDLHIDEYVLIYPEPFETLAKIIKKDINQVSPDTEVIPVKFELNDAWDFEEVFSNLLDFLKKTEFDINKKDYIFNITTGTHVEQICIFLLTESRHFPGKLIQSSPETDDKVRNTVGSYSIIDLDLSRYDKIASRFAQEKKDDIFFLKSGIETRNKEFNRLIERIETVAIRSKDPILLTGPTGSGKSMLAGRIYDLKKSKSLVTGDFVEINCATIRGDQAMSTLFGHKKGSFTGALGDRQGLLKRADCGIVFLDEIGELGLDEQAMLLKAIEEKKFISIGSDKETSSDFQIICGTNRDLGCEVAGHRFREDLYARINIWSFKMPGLKDRLEDIKPNVMYELKRYTDKTGYVVTFSRELMDRFLSFCISPDASWKANFRDLNNSITRMCTLARSGRITEDILNDEIDRLNLGWKTSAGEPDTALPDNLMKRMNDIDLFDRMQVENVIRICRGSRTLSEAGRKLFSVSRLSKNSTNDADRLKKYLAKFGIKWEDFS
jgi:transcriptional regulatory protein RtcR